MSTSAADILVKAYFPGKSAFKPGGTLSNYLDVMVEGEHPCCETSRSAADHASGEDIDIKGPTGEITYLGNGRFRVNDDEFQFDKVSPH
jgi:nitrate reductase (NAD(P)H)